MRNYRSKRRTLLKTIMFLLAVSGMLPLQAAEPVLQRADEDFLREQAQRIVQSAALPAGPKRPRATLRAKLR